MKKWFACLLAMLLLAALAGCRDGGDIPAFANISWTRSGDGDTEFLHFGGDGTFSYYCACGNSVNDSDLCEGYSYNDRTKTVTLRYTEKTQAAVTQIRVERYSEDTLVLDFAGDMRTFSKVREEEIQADTLTYGDKNYVYLEFPQGIFCYSFAIDLDFDEEGIQPVPHDKFDFVCSEGDLFVAESNLDAAKRYYGDDQNYTWWARVESVELDHLYTVELSLTSEEREYLYAMEGMEKKETMLFEEIEEFATLGKTSKDGLISATTELVWHENAWYWRSEVIDETAEGWPEYIFPLPQSLWERIVPPNTETPPIG